MLKDRVKFLRNKKNISQGELAALAGLRQSQVSKIERGSRKVAADELKKLAAALGVPVSALLEDSPLRAVGE